MARICRFGIAAGVLLLAICAPRTAAACACCAEHFTGSDQSGQFKDWHWCDLSILRLKGHFSESTQEPALDNISGKMEGRFEPQSCIFYLKTADGKTTFSVQFTADGNYEERTRDSLLFENLPPEDEIRGDASLLKELKIPGKISVVESKDGKVAYSMHEKTYLTLYGRGNNCFGARNYRQWDISFGITYMGKLHPCGAHGSVQVPIDEDWPPK